MCAVTAVYGQHSCRHADVRVAGAALEQPPPKQEGTSGVCSVLCSRNMYMGKCACGFGNRSIEGKSPVLCGSTTC